MKSTRNFKPTDKFLSLNVYQFPLGDCGGITDSLQTIWIPCSSGYMKYEDIEDKSLIFIPEDRGGGYHCLNPLMKPDGLIGPMSGGNLAYSSDSRCKRVYHIHDRFETVQQYQALSQ